MPDFSHVSSSLFNQILQNSITTCRADRGIVTIVAIQATKMPLNVNFATTESAPNAHITVA